MKKADFSPHSNIHFEILDKVEQMMKQETTIRDIASVITVLKNNGLLNYQDNRYQGKTVLYKALEKRKLDIVKLLLEAGANPAVKNFSGQNALYLALSDELADLDHKKIDGETLLSLLIGSIGSSEDIIDSELTRSHRFLRVIGIEAQSRACIFAAASSGQLKLLKLLLGQHPNYLNITRPSDGASLLLIAVKSQKISIVEYLIKRKANPDIPDHQGILPSHAAKTLANKAIIDLLRNSSHDPSQTVLHNAASNPIRMFEPVRQHQTNIHTIDHPKENYLIRLCRRFCRGF
jgi:ankyrin repeat protein